MYLVSKQLGSNHQVALFKNYNNALEYKRECEESIKNSKFLRDWEFHISITIQDITVLDADERTD